MLLEVPAGNFFFPPRRVDILEKRHPFEGFLRRAGVEVVRDLLAVAGEALFAVGVVVGTFGILLLPLGALGHAHAQAHLVLGIVPGDGVAQHEDEALAAKRLGRVALLDAARHLGRRDVVRAGVNRQLVRRARLELVHVLLLGALRVVCVPVLVEVVFLMWGGGADWGQRQGGMTEK